MVTFLALYRGDTIDTAALVTVTEEADVIRAVAELLLKKKLLQSEINDPVIECMAHATAKALSTIVDEAKCYA